MPFSSPGPAGKPFRTRAVLLATALTATAVGGFAPGATATTVPAPVQLPTGTVTLLTGDRVTVAQRPGQRPTVEYRPGPGRERIGYRTSGDRRRLLVVPADAAGPLAAGLLDPALFDVTGLLRQGYGRRPLSVIAGYRPGARQRGGADLAAGARRTRTLPSIDADVLTSDPRRPGALWSALAEHGRVRTTTGVRRIWLNPVLRPSLDVSAAQVGAPEAWKAGYTGKAVPVAVLDTGMKLDHPDLAGRVAESKDFTGTKPDGSDDVGHGTHVAGIVGGTGTASAGKYKGVAPDTRLLNGKVCEREGCPGDAIVAGMEWAATRARVVNMSLGDTATDGTDPVSQALNALTEKTGALFVVAAGNTGKDYDVSAPAVADAALAVGSLTKKGALSGFSSQGPRIGDHAVKPEIAAPGSEIVAARAKGTPVGDVNDPENGQKPIDDNYLQISGTSMATPHVAGAAAILAQAHPDWKGPQLKAALMASANPLAGISPWGQGAGRTDLAQALRQTVTASGSVGHFLRWPDRRPFTREVTFANSGDRAVRLRLAISAALHDGRPTPAGLLSLGGDQLTVPARGRATVRLTVDPGKLPTLDRPVGAAGHLTATGDGQRVSVPLSVVAEPESYDVTATVTGSDGKPAANQQVALLYGAGHYALDGFSGPDGVARIRVPKGRYQPFVALVEEAEDQRGPLQTAITAPPVEVAKATSLRFAATGARPVSLRTDRRGTAHEVTLLLSHPGFPYGGLEGVLGRTRVVPGRLDPTYTFAAWVDLSAVTRGDAPPAWVDHLAQVQRGGVFAVPELDGTPAAVAPVSVRLRGVPGSGVVGSAGVHPAVELPGVTFTPRSTPVGRERVERFSKGDWLVHGAVRHSGGSDEAFETAKLAVSGPGRLDLLSAVLGPDGRGGSREGDLFTAGPRMCVPVGATPSLLGNGPCPATKVLYRDGRKVAEAGPDRLWLEAELSAATATYTLTAAARNPAANWFPLSTLSEASWTFSSGRTPEPRSLPLLAVRFAPALDGANAAPTGRAFTFPVSVVRADLVGGWPKVTELSVEVSYDAGRTWKAVELTGSGAVRTAKVVHPKGPGYVSLRATAKDSRGNTVTQRVVNAYALAK